MAFATFVSCSSDSRQSPAYVDETLCTKCHEQQYLDWRNSHHDLAMQPATDSTVLGDFNNARFTHQGLTSRLFREDNRFLVYTEGESGKPDTFEIKYTFGVDPLQQYLVEFPGGKLQCLSIAWDTPQQRWFHLYPNEQISHADPLHWTGVYQTWNHMCADCHSTDVRKNFEMATGTYETTWEKIDVGCQACHGPGEAHVRWAETGAEETPATPQSYALTSSGSTEVENCAPCHSRRQMLAERNWLGKPLLDTFLPSLLREGLYYPDGQILDEVYVYGSFVQSKMYRSGVRCGDCHNPHSLKLVREGNAVCTQCHQMVPEKRFESLTAKNYDSPDHHFHEQGSAGAQCVACHAPERTYMVVDPRRDHSFRIPRPDLSLKIGTPNACNICHSDRTIEWAVQYVEKWYGTEREWHWGEAIAAAQSGTAGADSLLVRVLVNEEIPAISRATALELLQYYDVSAWKAEISRAIADADAMVRTAAMATAARLPAEECRILVEPRLTDPVRAVRMEAARVLAPFMTNGNARSVTADFSAALSEYRHSQKLLSDQPGGCFNLGILFESMGKADSAEINYADALAKDPHFLPARFNLANLLNRQTRNDEAEKILVNGTLLHPENWQLHYSLGLLLAEKKELEKAAQALASAARLEPENSRLLYNYALCLQQLSRRPEAERAFLKAIRLNQDDVSVLHALTVFYMQDSDWDEAHTYAKRLAQMFPEDAQVERLLDHIEENL